MTANRLLQKTEKIEIQAYKAPTNAQELMWTHVPFSGSPLRHPHDEDKLVLMTDPYSANCPYYEFNADDISFVEQLPSLVNVDGQTVAMVRI